MVKSPYLARGSARSRFCRVDKIHDAYPLICGRCTCEEFKVYAVYDGDEAVGMVCECKDCREEYPVIVPEPTYDA